MFNNLSSFDIFPLQRDVHIHLSHVNTPPPTSFIKLSSFKSWFLLRLSTVSTNSTKDCQIAILKAKEWNLWIIYKHFLSCYIFQWTHISISVQSYNYIEISSLIYKRDQWIDFYINVNVNWHGLICFKICCIFFK